MKIEMNTIYHLPTQELEDDFLRQADEQGIKWTYEGKASMSKHWGMYKGNHCIRVTTKGLTYCERSMYENDSIFRSYPIVKWEIEPNFKVGDKVVFARKDTGNMSFWNKEFTIGKECKVTGYGMSNSIRVDNGFIMPMECFDLAPEPKPQFKVGDWVKVTRAILSDDDKHIGEIAKVVWVDCDGDCNLEGISLLMLKEQLELAEEPKTIVKEQTTVKKVRCIDALFSQGRLKSNQIYEVSEGITPNGTKYYIAEGVEGTFLQNRFEDVVEEKYPQIEIIGGVKVVFNPPYTIVSFNPIGGRKQEGKAKCNPKDEFDKWTGFKVAHERMSKPCSK